MPVKNSAESLIGLWRALMIGILLVICAAVRSWAFSISVTPTVPAPTPISLPTTITSPTIGGSPVSGDIYINVVDVNRNQIERFKDVVVRVSDSNYMDTGADGQLKVTSCPPGHHILAWAPDYEIASKACDGQTQTYDIPLTHLRAEDSPYYTWFSGESSCIPCHGSSLIFNSSTGATYNEIDEWFHSGHSKVFRRPYFRSMYRATSLLGKPSVPARPIIMDNQWVPVPPELNQDYHGPGFRLDFPQQPGNCAYCHAPAAVQASQSGAYLDTPDAGRVAEEGVTCDVCHKVYGVILDDSGFPFTDSPGILSFQFMRPTNNEIFMTGPFANMIRTGLNALVVPSTPINHRLTCAPVFSRSEFCAPCHFGKFGDMMIYNSYGEWKASPYAANTGDGVYRTCQDCHMSYLYEGVPEEPLSQRQACSASDPRFQDFNHNVMRVAVDGMANREIPYMVKNAAEIKVEFAQPAGKNTLDFTVNVKNTKAGHKFPTDSPLRHLILVLHAEDRVKTPLIQVGGDRIPNWAGPGPATSAAYAQRLEQNGVKDYSGLPGEIFANLLVEEETNLSPGMAYWNETKQASPNSDTRLRPLVPDPSFYSFSVPDAGDVKITVELIYRFAFFDLMVWQEWLDWQPFERADILVAQVECNGSPTQPQALTQSCRPIEP